MKMTEFHVEYLCHNERCSDVIRDKSYHPQPSQMERHYKDLCSGCEYEEEQLQMMYEKQLMSWVQKDPRAFEAFRAVVRASRNLSSGERIDPTAFGAPALPIASGLSALPLIDGNPDSYNTSEVLELIEVHLRYLSFEREQRGVSLSPLEEWKREQLVREGVPAEWAEPWVEE